MCAVGHSDRQQAVAGSLALLVSVTHRVNVEGANGDVWQPKIFSSKQSICAMKLLAVTVSSIPKFSVRIQTQQLV